MNLFWKNKLIFIFFIMFELGKTLSDFFFSFLLKIYSFESLSLKNGVQREIETHGEIFHLLVYFINGCNDQGWTKLKPGAISFIQVFCLVERGPNICTIFHFFSQAINRDLVLHGTGAGTVVLHANPLHVVPATLKLLNGVQYFQATVQTSKYVLRIPLICFTWYSLPLIQCLDFATR